MIRIKEGVIFKSLLPEMYSLFPILNMIYAKRNFPCVITSANDGKHMDGSKHYTDEAFDVRTKSLPSPEVKRSVVEEIRQKVGKDYDVLFEHEGLDAEHIHIEWDPQG